MLGRSTADNQLLQEEPSKGPLSSRFWNDQLMTVEANFSKTSGSVALARRFTEELLGGISGAVAAEIVLMVSELATNAVLHAATSFRLRLERTNDFVRVEIADGGSGDVHRRSLQIKVPPGAGQPHSGVGLAVVLSSQVKEDLIHSGNPKLAQDTRTMTNLIHPIGIDSALIAARTECRKVGVR